MHCVAGRHSHALIAKTNHLDSCIKGQILEQTDEERDVAVQQNHSMNLFAIHAPTCGNITTLCHKANPHIANAEKLEQIQCLML